MKSELAIGPENAVAELQSALLSRILGQDEAVRKVANLAAEYVADCAEQRNTGLAMLCAGPEGVGKGLLCKQLARNLFGYEDAMLHLDMADFNHKRSIATLIGSEPGDIGGLISGKLCQAIRARPQSLVLFDSVQLAHPNILALLRSMLALGVLIDAHGRRIDVKNTLFVLSTDEHSNLSPSLLEEIAETIDFRPLSKDDLRVLVLRNLQRLQWRYLDQGIQIEFKDAVVEELLCDTDSAHGFCSIKRRIKKSIDFPLTEGIEAGHFSHEDCLMAVVNDKIISFDKMD